MREAPCPLSAVSMWTDLDRPDPPCYSTEVLNDFFYGASTAACRENECSTRRADGEASNYHLENEICTLLHSHTPNAFKKHCHHVKNNVVVAPTRKSRSHLSPHYNPYAPTALHQQHHRRLPIERPSRLYTSLQQTNHSSQGEAKHWCFDFIVDEDESAGPTAIKRNIGIYRRKESSPPLSS